MIEIKVLGGGCPNCKTLAAHVEAAATALGVDYTLTKVTDIREIMAAGVMATPGLIIDGVVRSSGKVLSVDEIKKLLA